jgi:hypothetical protein
VIVIGVGDLQLADGAKFPGVVIKATREELQAVAGNILYKEVEVLPVESGADTHRDIWDEKMETMVDALVAVDRRVRDAKPSKRYTRDEVLAMLDEIDPGPNGKGGAE